MRASVVLVAIGLVAGACGDTGTVTEPAPAATTSAPTTTTVAVAVPVVDAASLAEQVERVSNPAVRFVHRQSQTNRARARRALNVWHSLGD